MPYQRKDFEFIKAIGKGGFGQVWLVRRRRDDATFAIKEMFKARILSKRSIHSVINERRLLASLKHAFIVNMMYAFQDNDNLYQVMEHHAGGDLRYHLIHQDENFEEEQVKFMIACIIEGLEFMHSR